MYDGTQGITTGQQALTWHPRITAVQKTACHLTELPFPGNIWWHCGFTPFYIHLYFLFYCIFLICYIIIIFISFFYLSYEKIFLKNLEMGRQGEILYIKTMQKWDIFCYIHNGSEKKLFLWCLSVNVSCIKKIIINIIYKWWWTLINKVSHCISLLNS